MHADSNKNSNIVAVILAAGKSSRTWPISNTEGKGHKGRVKIGGKSIVEHVIDEIRNNTSIKDIIIVKRKEEELLEIEGVKEVVQHPPLGTGHALKEVYKAFPNYIKYLIVNAYHMFSGNLFKKLLEQANQQEEGGLILTPTEQIEKYGIAEINEKGEVRRVVEKPKKGEINSNLRIIGVYMLPNKFMKLLSSKTENREDELERTLDEYAKKEKIKGLVIDKEDEPPSLKYAWEYLDFLHLYLKNKNKSFIGKADIKEGVIIDENKGPVHIGNNTTIYENAVIRGPAYIGDNVVIGNNSVIRESVIEDNVVIGAFSEIARSLIQEEVHIHSGYIGDSVISRGCKIGAGIITANRRMDRKEIEVYFKGKKINTHKKSIGVMMGEEVNVGVGVKFMPSTFIGKGAVIYPNAVIKGIIKDGEVIKTEIYTSSSD